MIASMRPSSSSCWSTSPSLSVPYVQSHLRPLKAPFASANNCCCCCHCGGQEDVQGHQRFGTNEWIAGRMDEHERRSSRRFGIQRGIFVSLPGPYQRANVHYNCNLHKAGGRWVGRSVTVAAAAAAATATSPLPLRRPLRPLHAHRSLPQTNIGFCAWKTLWWAT